MSGYDIVKIAAKYWRDKIEQSLGERHVYFADILDMFEVFLMTKVLIELREKGSCTLENNGELVGVLQEVCFLNNLDISLVPTGISMFVTPSDIKVFDVMSSKTETITEVKTLKRVKNESKK